jgi:hypothetical protein
MAKAQSVIDVVLIEVERNLSAVQYAPAPYASMKARLAAMRKDVT